ncbi:protein-tyrosine-phosphatase [Mycolicibacterium sp. SCSIO 43805]|uniref:arsenate reductase/protein-tyrosine-phosphatase family protein n=1 Tax=Mycolicibacterium sp. SCSIO 43805 TaxID=3378074 RepID=UPI003AB10C87
MSIVYAERSGLSGLVMSSAGTHALVGQPMHPHAAAILTELGGSADGFSARKLTPKVVARADLVLTMTKAHRDAVLELAPTKLRATFTLAEAARLIVDHGARDICALSECRSQVSPPRLEDVPDPIGQRIDAFVQVGDRLSTLLPPIVGLCGDLRG